MPPHDTATPMVKTPMVERCAARARRARNWAWPVRLALLVCVGVAIWQEPRLLPWLHARMQEAVAHAGGALEHAAQIGWRVAGAGRLSSDKGAGVSGWIIEVLSP